MCPNTCFSRTTYSLSRYYVKVNWIVLTARPGGGSQIIHFNIYKRKQLKSVQSALSNLLTTSATHGTFTRLSTKRGLISIIKLMQFTVVRFY